MSQIAELSVEECVSLLGTTKVGRIGVVTPAGPVIFPVNYSVLEDSIVFRTLPYGVVANNAHAAQVAFEVDSLDDAIEEGWSVLATGPARRLEDPDEVRAIRQELDPQPWADGHRNLYFRVEWTSLTGRRLGRDRSADRSPGSGSPSATGPRAP